MGLMSWRGVAAELGTGTGHGPSLVDFVFSLRLSSLSLSSAGNGSHPGLPTLYLSDRRSDDTHTFPTSLYI